MKKNIRSVCATFLLLCTAPALVSAETETANTPPRFEIERSQVHTFGSAEHSYDVFVRLPQGYDKPENAQRKYPVVYLTDGPYTFEVASGVTRVPIGHDTFEPIILAGLGYAQGEDPAVSRERDLTPYPDVRNKPYPTGGARAYLDFIKERVLPVVEKTYRIDTSRRTLAGQSYGGLFGIWVLLTEPQLFRNYILTSPSLWYNRRALLATEAAFAARHIDLIANVYFATGGFEHPAPCGREIKECSNADMVADQATLVGQLRSRHYPHLHLHARTVDGAYHTTTFPVGLLWALQDLFLTHRIDAK